jgi:HEAT repeat protein
MRPLAQHSAFVASLATLTFVIQIAIYSPSSFSSRIHSNTQAPGETGAEVSRWTSLLKSSDEEERRNAALQLSRLKDDSAGSALASALTDPSPRVRAAAAAGLAERGEESAAPLLASRLAQDKDKFVRKITGYALGGFHGHERTAALVAALKDKDMEVRGAVAVSLGDHPDAEAIPALSVALSDKTAFVRAQAAHALGVNGRAASQAVPNLIHLLTKDDDPEVRRRAATALGEIGDRSALPALERASHDKDPYLDQAAVEAIRIIKGIR